MHLSDVEADVLVKQHRELVDRLLEPGPGQSTNLPAWVDPGPGSLVLVEDYLHHLDLDAGAINGVLRQAYPYLDRVPGLKGEVHARVRFIGWMTLRGFRQLAPAIRAAQAEPDGMRKLGFASGAPAYETMRQFLHERLAGGRFDQLKMALLREEKRLLPALGQAQVEDATPVEARRRDEAAPFNPHYGVRMHKAELRWDVDHDALLADQFYHGTAHESRLLEPLSKRLEGVGVHAQTLTVDGAYTGFLALAAQWRRGTRVLFRVQEGWVVDAAASRMDVEKRLHHHWREDGFPTDGSWESKVRFLYDHGSLQDREAVGRWVRDAALNHPSLGDAQRISADRSQNEGHNAGIKALPWTPARQGAKWMLRRVQACTLTLHLVQLARLENGVTTRLCRTGYLV